MNGDKLIESVLGTLNMIQELDSDAINELISKRVICGHELADVQNIPVVETDNPDEFEFGLLGVVNAIIAPYVDEGVKICAVWDEHTNFMGFKRVDFHAENKT
jgi:hypothetical protein